MQEQKNNSTNQQSPFSLGILKQHGLQIVIQDFQKNLRDSAISNFVQTAQQIFTMPNILEAIQNDIKSSLKLVEINISQSLNDLLNNNIPAGQLFSNLPDFTELIIEYKRLEKEVQERYEQNLEADGLQYSVHFGLGDTSTFETMVEIALADPLDRGKIVINTLSSDIESDEFEKTLKNFFASSTTLKPRWRIVQKGLVAHTDKNYDVSIPVLLPQLEGIVADALYLRGFVVIKNNKVYKKDIGKDGKEVELKGLGSFDQLKKDFKSIKLLNDVIDFLTNSLVPERNPILHGRNIEYADMKRSTEILAVIFIFAREIADFEAKAQV